MASMTAMFTGLSGLNSAARQLDVIGNNIANVNTTGYKSSRLMFAPTFSSNLSLGSAPSDVSGGTNPAQVGLGATIAGMQRNFSNGAISTTGVQTDLAIEGAGFFIVRDGQQTYYTRGGSFQRNQANDLVTIGGARVMGFGVDSQFNIVEGNLIPMNIPLGTLTLAEATRAVTFNGNLNAAGSPSTTGSVHSTRALYTDSGLTNEADGTENLTAGGSNLYISDGAGGFSLAIEGGQNTIITINGAEKAGKDLGTFTFGFMDSATASARGVDGFGSTLADFTAFLEQIFGLTDANVSGQSLGGNITINADGQIVITGNEGAAQDLNINTASFTATSDSGSAVSQPFVIARDATADGESVRTSFVVYDSLGTPLTIDLTFVLQEASEGDGTTWMFLAESSDSDALSRILGSGVVKFDANGKFISTSSDSFSIVRTNGATSPLSVQMNFSTGTDAISSLTGSTSTLAAVFQDGSPLGTLSNFSIGVDGTISGSFTNGLTRTIGQIALAMFTNPEGLVDMGGGMFASGPNSGAALIATPLDFGSGRLIGGALELSNVDLSQEFINMILASTGYSASSRIITTMNDLIQQLLVLGR